MTALCGFGNSARPTETRLCSCLLNLHSHLSKSKGRELKLRVRDISDVSAAEPVEGEVLVPYILAPSPSVVGGSVPEACGQHFPVVRGRTPVGPGYWTRCQVAEQDHALLNFVRLALPPPQNHVAGVGCLEVPVLGERGQNLSTSSLSFPKCVIKTLTGTPDTFNFASSMQASSPSGEGSKRRFADKIGNLVTMAQPQVLSAVVGPKSEYQPSSCSSHSTMSLLRVIERLMSVSRRPKTLQPELRSRSVDWGKLIKPLLS